MDQKKWVEERIDELYLLEKHASERFDRFEATFKKQLELINSQHAAIRESSEQQHDLVNNIQANLNDSHIFYNRLLKIGGFAFGALCLGIIVVIFAWWHIDNLTAQNKALEKYVLYEAKRLPPMVEQNGQTYVRIVENTTTSELTKPDGSFYPGYYAQLYTQQQSGNNTED